MQARLEAALAPLLDRAGLLVGDAIDARHCSDWTGVQGRPLAVVRPRGTQEAAAVMAALHALRQPVVVQGGMTGLVAGAVPQPGEVALSLERMQAIGAVDAAQACVTVEAGATLQAVQEQVGNEGWLFPVDIGSRGSCQIGGLVATNAGGNRVLRYGMTRGSVRGLEVVLADGTIVSRMTPMLKDNAGYDLKHLFIGSEGTLGVITRVLLALEPLPASSQTALLSLHGFAQVTALLDLCRRRLGACFTSFEVMWRDYVDTVSGLPSVGAPPWHKLGSHLVLVEAMGSDPPADAVRFEQCMARALELGEGVDVVIAQSLADAARLWSLREAVGEAAALIAPWVGFDVSLPRCEIEAYVAEVHIALAKLGGLRTQTYGHLGDGNLHFVIGPADADVAAEIKRIVHTLAGARGGSISGEHGIGVLKKKHLALTRSPEEVALMRALKRALDPHQLLNRGRIFDLDPA